MKQDGGGWLERLLLSGAFWYVLPTPAIYLLNRQRVKEPLQIGPMPTNDLSQRERRRLLEASEARLANIEAKGPGIAAVTAVLAAGVLVALTDGWGEAGWPAKGFLVLAAVYTALSLPTAIYLVGPLKRHVIDVPDIEEAIGDAEPEERLAAISAKAAMRNDLQNRRLANHLDAARRELAYGYGLLLCWAVLAFAGGVVQDAGSEPRGKPPAFEVSGHRHSHSKSPLDDASTRDAARHGAGGRINQGQACGPPATGERQNQAGGCSSR